MVNTQRYLILYDKTIFTVTSSFHYFIFYYLQKYYTSGSIRKNETLKI